MELIFPELEVGQYVVLMAESSTGIVLTVERKRSISSTDEIFKVCKSLFDTHIYINEVKKEEPFIEFSIFDWNHKFVDVVAGNDQRE